MKGVNWVYACPYIITLNNKILSTFPLFTPTYSIYLILTTSWKWILVSQFIVSICRKLILTILNICFWTKEEERRCVYCNMPNAVPKPVGFTGFKCPAYCCNGQCSKTSQSKSPMVPSQKCLDKIIEPSLYSLETVREIQWDSNWKGKGPILCWDLYQPSNKETKSTNHNHKNNIGSPGCFCCSH